MVDEGFLHADNTVVVANGAVLAGGLPVALSGGAIHPGAIRVLAIEGAKEVPLQVPTHDPGQGREVPGLALVQIDLGDGIDAEGFAGNLALEVVADKLVIRGVEPETRSELGRGGRSGGSHGPSRIGGRCAAVHQIIGGRRRRIIGEMEAIGIGFLSEIGFSFTYSFRFLR